MTDQSPLKKLPPSSNRWLAIGLEENEAAVWSVEHITVYTQRVLGDWMLARTESIETPSEQFARKCHSLPLNLEWKRWALEHEAKEVRFWPVLPDRSLVVKTRIPVIVPPKTTIELYVNFPIWLEVSVLQKSEYYTLDTIVPTSLSNTWYGTQYEGQLCYALRSRARRSLEDLTDEPLRAVCLFRIINQSEDSLPVEKIKIDPNHLSLYQSASRLWTNHVTVTFKGNEEHSELHYNSSPPKELKKHTLIREALAPPNRGSIIDRLLFRSDDSEDQ